METGYLLDFTLVGGKRSISRDLHPEEFRNILNEPPD